MFPIIVLRLVRAPSWALQTSAPFTSLLVPVWGAQAKARTRRRTNYYKVLHIVKSHQLHHNQFDCNNSRSMANQCSPTIPYPYQHHWKTCLTFAACRPSVHVSISTIRVAIRRCMLHAWTRHRSDRVGEERRRRPPTEALNVVANRLKWHLYGSVVLCCPRHAHGTLVRWCTDRMDLQKYCKR